MGENQNGSEVQALCKELKEAEEALHQTWEEWAIAMHGINSYLSTNHCFIISISMSYNIPTKYGWLPLLMTIYNLSRFV
jgi:hypothetical protein